MRKLKGVLTILPVRKFASAETVTWLGVSELDRMFPSPPIHTWQTRVESGSDPKLVQNLGASLSGFHGVRTQPPSTS